MTARTLPRPGELDWQRQAKCASADPAIFYPEGRGSSASAARAICRPCPVRAQCRAYALEHNEKFGIWGNTSEHERRRLRRGEPLATVQPAQRYRPGSYPSPPLQEALKQLAPAYGSIPAIANHVAARTDLSSMAVRHFIYGQVDRPRVTLKWATKVLTALNRPDLIPQIWPDAQDVAA